MSDPRRPDVTRPGKTSPLLQNLLASLRRGDVRDMWWALLDAWETRRWLRRAVAGLALLAIAGSVLWFWFVPWWSARNAIKMTRQWMEAGRLDQAAQTVHGALRRNPQQPELWLMASDIARLNQQHALAVEYAHRAAGYKPGEARYTLAWASAALQAEKTKEAGEALESMPAQVRENSAFAQRLLGELSRRENNIAQATSHFEAALRLEGPGAVNEIPLGLCLIASDAPDTRRRGLDMLSGWTADATWGATAARILLDDATRHDERPSMKKWAAALLVHPLCTVGDVPKALGALAVADRESFVSTLESMKAGHHDSPERAAQLAGWLNQIGEYKKALEWLQTLPADSLERPPLVQARAEALRSLGDWTGLEAITSRGDWGSNLEILRWTYGLLAAKQLGDTRRADELWKTLYNHALASSVHAHFAGSLAYSWGMVEEAEKLWWRTADQHGGAAYESLGALARHYQVSRDATGQYKVFNKLHSLRPQEDDVTNNFVFFATLTGNRQQAAELLARDLLKRHPGNPNYTATLAFVLLSKGLAAEALKLTTAFYDKPATPPGIAFVHGLALADTGSPEQGARILRSIEPTTLTLQEVDLINETLSRAKTAQP